MVMEHKELCLMFLNIFQMQAEDETDGYINWDMTLYDFMDWLEHSDISIALNVVE